MSSEQSGESKPPEERGKRRYKVLLVILLIIGAPLTLGILRGTWADTVERNPSSSAEGVIAQIYKTPSGPKVVRCSMVMDYPAEKIWSVVTDYDHFTEIFPNITSVKTERKAEGKYCMDTTIKTPLGSYVFQSNLTHEESKDMYIASWEGSGDQIKIDRGSWTLKRLGPEQTLVVYCLELRLKYLSRLVVRNFLLAELKPNLLAVKDAVRKKGVK